MPRPAATTECGRRAALALVAILIAGCAPEAEIEAPPARLVLTRADFADLSGWREDSQSEAAAALIRSCAELAKLPGDRSLDPGGVGGTVSDWQEPCAALAALAPADDAVARAFFERWFTPFLAADNARADGLFTGYFEAALDGARAPDARFAIPIYRRPDDLVTVDLGEFRESWTGERIAGRVAAGRLVPYESRADIAAGALAGRGLELAWVDDPVDAFFLHVQGSGTIRLAGGDALRVGYDGQNGHLYTALGRVLVDEGEMALEDVSMQSIRAWLEAHPARAQALMDRNASFVFFRALDGDGPVGAQGAVLTPGRSLAVDPRYVALSLPVWLETAAPTADGAGTRPLRRLMIAQDTGGAIKGPVRGDVFWGAGADAEAIAGHMNSRGRYFLLLPRAVAVAGG